MCGGGIALTVVPHAELCDDDVKALSRQMCGDCLVPIEECIHYEEIQLTKRRKQKWNS